MMADSKTTDPVLLYLFIFGPEEKFPVMNEYEWPRWRNHIVYVPSFGSEASSLLRISCCSWQNLLGHIYQKLLLTSSVRHFFFKRYRPSSEQLPHFGVAMATRATKQLSTSSCCVVVQDFYYNNTNTLLIWF